MHRRLVVVSRGCRTGKQTETLVDAIGTQLRKQIHGSLCMLQSCVEMPGNKIAPTVLRSGRKPRRAFWPAFKQSANNHQQSPTLISKTKAERDGNRAHGLASRLFRLRGLVTLLASRPRGFPTGKVPRLLVTGHASALRRRQAAASTSPLWPQSSRCVRRAWRRPPSMKEP